MPGALVLLCGRSFSGKSTVARHLRTALAAQVLSYDAINEERGLRGGQGMAVEEWIRTDHIAHDRARTLLEGDETVVIDDTSSPRFLRDAWRELARDSNATFALAFIDVDPEITRRRLVANRSAASRADVLDSVMAEHLDSFEPPAADEPHLRFADPSATAEIVRRVREAIAGP